MMKLSILFLFAFSVPGSSNDPIHWNENRPLEWVDFRGSVDPGSPYDAWTYSRIDYTYTWQTSEEGNILAQFTVTSTFVPEQSWYRPGFENQDLLHHERIHFDINEIHARMLRREFSAFRFTQNIEAQADSIFDIVFEKREKMTILYDTETDHGNNKPVQLKWKLSVAEKLNELEAYK